MHEATADQIVVLAMIEHRHADHPRVLDRTAHEFVILDAMSVIGNGDDAGLGKGTDRRQFLAREIY